MAKAAAMQQDFLTKYRLPLMILVAILVVLLILAVMMIAMYNNFVILDQDVKGKWSEVENQYQRQADLIPNVISTVGSAVKVETKYVTDVTNARTQWLNAKTEVEKDTAGFLMNNALTTYINAVGVAENYPTLQANKQYTQLIDELTGTQNRIAVARGKYIESVQAFNTGIKMFPANMFAGIFGFAGKEYYEATAPLVTIQIGTGTLP